ncbi:hypothetical protein NPIL_267191 [Nephila pilipes]|uniref:Uncharacterized protein n=1 Tax=Nephila pilipes TaxID=299642 RepID=A0A8X6MPV8_NEPPI|nr:hypothetical protein NPIL_267191 [Nephila pilipes]
MKKLNNLSQLFALRRGSYQLARAWANYPKETGRYVHGVFAEADVGPAEQPSESDPCFLWKFMKTRGDYNLVSAELRAIQEGKANYGKYLVEKARPPNRLDQVFDYPVHRLRIQIQYFNEGLLQRMISQGVRQVPSCGCVDPRPPPSTHDDTFSLITRNERHRQKDPSWCASAEESDR